jgi:hypothetical protein
MRAWSATARGDLKITIASPVASDRTCSGSIV